MTRGELRKLQKLQLKIAIEVKRICEEHNITYFLDCGSMLGAVRHKGFIPWDDDMDIGFLRQEYDKFIDVARNELGKEFYLLTWDDNENYPQPYAKLCLKDTIYQEKIAGNNENEEKGIFVDLFPYDNIADNKVVQFCNGVVRKLVSHMLMIQCGYRVWEGKGFFKKIKFLPLIVGSFIFSRKTLKSLFMHMAYMYKDVKTQEVGIEDGGITLHWRYKRNNLAKFIEIKFENENFIIPWKYDELLQTAYGNYMELPPEEKRWLGHEIEELDFGSYEEIEI